MVNNNEQVSREEEEAIYIGGSTQRRERERKSDIIIRDLFVYDTRQITKLSGIKHYSK